jgi:DNA modification methylase
MKNKKRAKIVVKDSKGITKRKGPPNRMNDLPYKEWMKFQKSFFWLDDHKNLVDQFINFFTKSVWEDGEPSRTAIINSNICESESNFGAREIHIFNTKNISELIDLLKQFVATKKKFDFILIDLRGILKGNRIADTFLERYQNEFFKFLRKSLTNERYCTILVNSSNSTTEGYPLPWSVALCCRKYFRLRDEKIGLNRTKASTLYCLNIQAKDDERPQEIIKSEDITSAKCEISIPSWLIPKPPPRKKYEVLHPAKYPETLISEFIEIFSSAGDNILDPMVGTGSTVLAAIRLERNGYGIDLSKEYLQISQERIIEELGLMPEKINGEEQNLQFPEFELRRPIQMGLFPNANPKGKAFIANGNASDIKNIKGINRQQYRYVCTSPPYWSMLKNPGSEGQRARKNKNLPLVYSDKEQDLGNIGSYDDFIEVLVKIYDEMSDLILPAGYMTVVVKNIKRNHVVHPLAWDLVIKLCGKKNKFRYVGTTLWCQDDVGLKPFAVGIVWVSNTVHHYCLHFQKK